MMNRVPKGYEDYEEKILALPLARKVSGEDYEHTPEDEGYSPIPDSSAVRGYNICGCDRCRIIRAKKRRSFKFSTSRCTRCGKLSTTIMTVCTKCYNEDKDAETN